MMKKKVLILLFLNAALIAAIFYCFSTRGQRLWRRHGSETLRAIEEITIDNLRSNYKFSLRRIARSGKWEVVWDDSAWPANDFAIENLYRTLENFAQKKINGAPELYFYEIVIVSKGVPKNIKLTEEEANSLFHGAKSLDNRDESVLTLFMDPRVFARVGDDCKIFKIKTYGDEFIFAKRYNRWFFDSPASNLEIKSELIAKFSHEIFSMEGKNISTAPRDVGPTNVSITLYGKNSSERANFFFANDGTCLAKSGTADLFFTINGEVFEKMIGAINNLLKFHIFVIEECNDIKIVSSENGERFNFHNLKSQGKWQFTHAKNGELRVSEIGEKSVMSILNFMRNAESISVLSELPTENKLFTITLNDGTDGRQIFNFYKNGDRSFVEPDGRGIKFEAEKNFDAMFMDALRANIPVESAEKR
jgi:hypothetical protein